MTTFLRIPYQLMLNAGFGMLPTPSSRDPFIYYATYDARKVRRALRAAYREAGKAFLATTRYSGTPDETKLLHWMAVRRYCRKYGVPA